MSLQSWKDEFYPVDASKVSKEDAAQHSLRKWEGLTQENLAKHGLWHSRHGLFESERTGSNDPSFPIDDSTCALCVHHADKTDLGCGNCPLLLVRGAPCDSDLLGERSPYQEFIWGRDPQPMIDLLKLAVHRERTK